MTDTVVVVGAGVTGLAVAWALRRAGLNVRLLEAADRAGGVLRSEWVQGICVEQGPQSLRGAGGAAAEIIESLGLIERVRGASKAASKRFLLHKGELWPVPGGPLQALSGGPLSVGAVVRAMGEPLVRRNPTDGETLHDFISRRLGPGIADPLVEAFVGGIYAGDSRQLEAASSFPKLTAFELEHGSILLGAFRGRRAERPEWLPRGAFTFDEGADVLVRALADGLGDALSLGEAVTSVRKNEAGFLVKTATESIQAAQVVLAVSPDAGAAIDSPYAKVYGAIPSAPVAAVHLAWPKGDGPQSEGFGWLAPSSERKDVLGAIWVSSVFPHLAPDHDVVRIMLGGARSPELAAREPQELVDHALSVVRTVQGEVGEPVFTHARSHHSGIPQYVLGHGARRLELASVPGLHTVGWGVTGVGITQCLEAAKQTAEAIGRSLVGGE
ncbi:MAG: oxygen-dependent protoporphyrinogen oxidase [Kiritimatiellia bacterium]|jgi:oxygen-dependent protoporphyrinogen oxidase